MKRDLVSIVAVGALVLGSLTAVAQNKKPPATAGEFLKLTSESLALDVKSGVKPKNLQRTSRFLGFQGQVDRIQLAFVLDGTESMSQEFASLRTNLDAFAKGILDSYGKKNTTLELTAVVYRDIGDPKPIQTLSTKFLELESFRTEFRVMEIGSGEPYFQERVDEGLHAAITTLNWAPATESSVARCILLCGDAPPYSEDDDAYDNKEIQAAFRKYSTSKLVEAAKERQISIYSVLCSSGFKEGNARNAELSRTAEVLRPDMAKFMRTISAKTGGGYIDTSDLDQVRQYVDQQFVVLRQVKEITQDEIQRVREQRQDTVERPQIRLAVLPHTSFEKMTFEPWIRTDNAEPEPRPEVLVATQMRQLLPEVGDGGVLVVGPTEVAKEVQRVVTQFKSDPERISSLATALKVDYVIWGKYEETGKQQSLSTGIYGGLGGDLIVNASTKAPINAEFALSKQTHITLQKLSEAVATTEGTEFAEKSHKAAFSRDGKQPESQAMVTPVARDLRAQRSLLAGMESLEQALGYLKPEFEKDPTAAERSTELLQNSIAELKLTIAKEPNNPLAHLLISCCYYNLTEKGQIGVEHRQFTEHLEKAYEYRNSELPSIAGKDVAYLSDSRKTEVEAYHALFNNRPREAVKLFQEISKTKESVRGHFGLRANWMLAGLYLGDWGVSSTEPSLLSTDKARQHILNIMAFWSGSPEDKFYRNSVFNEKPVGPPSGPRNVELTSVFEPFH